MLSYDWVKIILTVAGIILIWSFLFSATSTKITNTQLFTVHSYKGNNLLDSNFKNSLNKGFKEEKIFSYEVIETDYYDYSSTGNETYQLLTTRLSVGEGDVIFLAPSISQVLTDEDKTEISFAQEFVSAYYYMLYNFDKDENGNYTDKSFFGEMENYLELFFGENWETGDLDETTVEKAFKARIKKNNDKRFKTKAQIQQGITWEKERLLKYRNALLETYQYMEDGYIKTEEYAVMDAITEEEAKHYYTLNICPDENKATKLKDIISYSEEYTDDEGLKQDKTKAENMQVAFFNISSIEKGYRYESLLYINYIVRSSLTA